MHINDLKVGDFARIISLKSGLPAYRQRLLAMGFLPGTIIQLQRVAPLGDPVEIRVRGIALTLRKKEAALLLLQSLTI